jgi:RNA polymerase sigma factor (TIGR02999 family)
MPETGGGSAEVARKLPGRDCFIRLRTRPLASNGLVPLRTQRSEAILQGNVVFLLSLASPLALGRSKPVLDPDALAFGWLVVISGVMLMVMSHVTRILSAIEQGDPSAAEQLLPLVYEELRKLAAQKLNQEKPGQTLQATALVHEAYLRLVDVEKVQHWNSRGHFFAAAAEAMRRILVEQARRKGRYKHGGGRQRLPLDPNLVADNSDAEELLAISDALDRLASQDEQAAALVKLRYFAGLPLEKAAEALGIPRSTAFVHWSFARAALRVLLETDLDSRPS